MNIEDPDQLMTPEIVRATCRAVGVPEPSRVLNVGRKGRQLCYALKFSPASGLGVCVLRIDRWFPIQGNGLLHELAARVSASMLGVIPFGPEPTVVPPGALSSVAFLEPFRELTPGMRLVGLDRSAWATVALDLGRVMRDLAETPAHRFGTRVESNRFVPSRRTWADEWTARVYQLYRGAARGGLDFGALSERLLEGVRSRHAALDAVENFTLIHGELKGNALEYDLSSGLPKLERVTGWDGAMWGDPLVEFGYLLTLSPENLGPILASYGEDKVRSILEDSQAIARIEAYLYTVCLQRPRDIAYQLLEHQDPSGMRMLDLSRGMAEQVLTKHFVQDRLEEALEHLEPTQLTSGPKPEIAPTATRIAVSILRGDSYIPVDHMSLINAVLGCANLGWGLAHDPVRAQATYLVFDALMNHANRRTRADHFEPISQYEAWRDRLIEDILRGAFKQQHVVSTNSLTLCWLGMEALDRLGETVSASVLRGLERSVRSAMVIDGYRREAATAHLLQHAVCGLAAIIRLGQLWTGDEELVEELMRRYEEVICDLAEQASGLPCAPSVDVFPDEALLPLLVEDGLQDEKRVARPLLVHALRTISGSSYLPADGASIISWCEQS